MSLRGDFFDKLTRVQRNLLADSLELPNLSREQFVGLVDGKIEDFELMASEFSVDRLSEFLDTWGLVSPSQDGKIAYMYATAAISSRWTSKNDAQNLVAIREAYGDKALWFPYDEPAELQRLAENLKHGDSRFFLSGSTILYGAPGHELRAFNNQELGEIDDPELLGQAHEFIWQTMRLRPELRYPYLELFEKLTSELPDEFGPDLRADFAPRIDKPEVKQVLSDVFNFAMRYRQWGGMQHQYPLWTSDTFDIELDDPNFDVEAYAKPHKPDFSTPAGQFVAGLRVMNDDDTTIGSLVETLTRAGTSDLLKLVCFYSLEFYGCAIANPDTIYN